MNTVNKVFRQFYSSYLDSNAPNRQQAKVAKRIMTCRTAELGGHTNVCDRCGHIDVYYNSCRDRHCPLCQGINSAVWVDQRLKDVVNAPYFHVVFTMPDELRMPIYQNQRLLYGLMYKAASETLLELSQDPKHLGAQPGFFCVLHTWGQDLHYHPHVHAVVMAGGLTKLNKWKASRKKFFIPVKVLSKKFRGKYLDYLKQYYLQGKLSFHGSQEHLSKRYALQALLDKCYAKNWYSYSKDSFAGPQSAIEYLGRYTNRIAIGNSRIVRQDVESVTFSIRDNKEGQKRKTCTLKGIEFVRRFLMHVLPHGFVKVRYYGLLAPRNKKTKLALCRRLTKSLNYKPKFEGLTPLEVLTIILGKDVRKCPLCQQHMCRGPLLGTEP